MAAASDFNFREVKILYSECLGRGAYGVVYKAECDRLLCAAKCIHATFFESGDPGQESTVIAFQRECQLLSALKHPNIVQYLGTHYERGTRSSITLLMELMDSNLQSYLEKHASAPLPFYLEINFIHDVALALKYLHEHGIHHRDLSTKNILLLGELRAKVSDFGVAKLNDPHSGYTSQTPVPGNICYMPPEVLLQPPTYSERIDEFSLGVCMIEMLTRQYPQPTSHLETVNVIPSSGDVTERRQILQTVPELERRRRDIDLVHDRSHPMMVLAELCLKTSPEDRPSAEQLCQQLQCLKMTNVYHESKSESKKLGASDEASKFSSDWTVIDISNDEQAEKLQRQNKELVQQVDDIKEKLSLREKQLQQVAIDLESRQAQISRLSNELQNLEDMRQRQVSRLRSELETLQQERQSESARHSLELSNLHERLESLRIVATQKEADRLEMEETLSFLQTEMMEQLSSHEVSRERDQNELKKELAEKDGLIQGLRESLTSREDEVRQLQQQIRRMQEVSSLPDITGLPMSRWDKLRQRQQLQFSWSKGTPPPCNFSRVVSQVVSHNARVCIGVTDPQRHSTAVWEYNLAANNWKRHPQIESSQSTVAFLRERLAAVGGSHSARVLCLSSDAKPKWTLSFPLMTLARALPSCAFSDPYLLVAGGEVASHDSTYEAVNDVEILNIDEGSWKMVRPFPAVFGIFKRLSVFAIQDTFYFLGGYDGDCQTRKVFKCSLSGLLNQTTKENPWKILQESPRIGATFAVFDGRLLALGGCEDYTLTPSNDVYLFNSRSNFGQWELVGKLRRPLMHGLVGATTTDKKKALVVIGEEFTDVGFSLN